MTELYDMMKDALVPLKIADILCSAEEFLPIRYQYDFCLPDYPQNDRDLQIPAPAERFLRLIGGGPVDKSAPFAVSIRPFEGLFILESLRGGGQLTLDPPGKSARQNAGSPSRIPHQNADTTTGISRRASDTVVGISRRASDTTTGISRRASDTATGISRRASNTATEISRRTADSPARIIKDGDILIFSGSASCHLRSTLLPWSFRLFFVGGSDLSCFLPLLNQFYMTDRTKSPAIASAVEKLGAFPARINIGSLIRMHSLLTQILSDVCLSVLPENQVFSGNIPAYLRDMHTYIHDCRNLSFSLADQEALHGISRYRLCREYSAAFSISPLKDFTLVRIEEAKKLLLNTDLQVQEISSKIGYENANHFIRLFKAETGMTPGAFRSAYTSI